jgi:NitT/TauT family transport system substrate-binding protein
MTMNRRTLLAAVFAMPFVPRRAHAADKVRYILPTPPDLPTAGIWRMADHLGYYRDAGLEVEFLVGKGGVDAASQVGADNGDFSGGMGDTSMIVRANGVPVKGIFLAGDGALTVLAARGDSGIASPKDLKGKSVSVLGFQDTTYYALLGMLSSVGLTKSDVDIQALGPGGVTQALVAGTVQATATIPDFIAAAQMTGLDLQLYSIKSYTPSMAQATLASEKMIRDNPDTVRRFVKATLHSFGDFRADPSGMARRFAQATPSQQGREALLERIYGMYARFTWGNPSKPGAFDPAILEQLQKFYVGNGIIRRATPVQDLYSNAFVTSVG